MTGEFRQKGVLVVYGTQNPDPSGTEYDRKTAEEIADNLRTFYSLWPREG
ncbi:hypothetical protein [Thermococcus sp.]|nr:hypothetical protein [Thermococcus sp.]